MKILIGYDGSRSAEAALDDLRKAGLPEIVEVLVVTVAEIWMPSPPKNNGLKEFASKAIPGWIKKHNSISERSWSEAETIGDSASRRLQSKFPDWKVLLEISSGSPAREILTKAAEFKPDLIIVGSQGKNSVNPLFPGSTSRKIFSEAKCSVRVARVAAAIETDAVRLIVGYDGSAGAESAVKNVALRNWSKSGKVRLVTVIDSLVPAEISRFVSTVADLVEEEKQADRLWAENLAESALRRLNDSGLDAKLVVCEGNPKRILIEEARKWNADCIFVGSHSSAFESDGFPVGSTSTAIAERAQCSVEVVR
jgi:nucleotide-binding universal stress UspA family protein